ncbi:casein kinase II subunit beta-2-like isoform X1 [Malus sylvestris]|uniref:casein kinase II subunit beta-2-like isoform X1 n=1 Tax=Malus sylvestris TaxID=3752 RepID=UPI0021ABED30|nr:casein kinase II subunit beta-2-like isoform X1 [Malus sylvestris]
MPKDQRGVIRSRSEPALNPNRLRDKSLAPSTSLAANPDDTDTFYDQAESADTSCKDSDVRCYGDEDASWISWFCNQKGNEFFCEVDDDYILDDFNRSGLRNHVPFYDYALDLMLDIESSNDGLTDEEQNNLIESATEMLYGLIHARYIATNKGLSAMCAIQLEKYRNYDFGRCPRVNCNKQHCLPVGESDIPRLSTVKIYCPKCEDIYPPQSRHQEEIDGAYFGTTFPHLFFLTYGHLKPQKAIQNYVPRIHGFKVRNE